MGLTTSSANVGLSIATGATSRRIGFACGAMLIALAFVPKLAVLFAIMPGPVIGVSGVFHGAASSSLPEFRFLPRA